MDSESDRINALWQKLSDAEAPKWERPQDLNRLSMQGLWGASVVARVVRSMGSIRIAGPNVLEHQARLDAAGHILVSFQKLVNAAGAARRGIRSNRGSLPGDVLTLTQLKLMMQPLPGSMVFEIGPESLPETELVGDKGVAILDQAHRQFVDECVEDAIRLMSVAHGLGADADKSEFVHMIESGGPRVAVAVREFAKGVEQSALDVNLEWREPERETARATFTPSDAELVRKLVVARELDQEEVTLTGRLVTLSTEDRWQLDIGEDARIVVDATTLPEEVDVTQFRLREIIVLVAKPVVRELPGGATVTTYRAVSARPLSTPGDVHGAS